MRVLMLSDHRTEGGAAIAASRLASALASRGDLVVRVVAEADGDSASVVRLRASAGRWEVARRALRSSVRDLPLRGSVRARWTELIDEVRPDGINVHNLHGARSLGWDQELVGLAAARVPTIWTLHDMWSFTGRCAYNAGCRQFERRCTASCPTASEYPALPPWRIRAASVAKANVLGARGLRAATPSQWLRREAVVGGWPSSSVRCIPNPVPLSTFHPRLRTEGRRQLGVADAERVALVVAQDLADPRKGMDLLIPAMAGSPFRFLAMGGRGAVPGAEALGRVDDVHRKALVFAAADVVVIPSREDNLPVVAQEAMACGTPVIAFDTGGLPDMVRPGISGHLVQEVSSGTLRNALLLAAEDCHKLRHGARETAMEWEPGRIADQYRHLFQSISA